MEIEDLKKIPITSLLSHLGHEPAYKIKGMTQWMYHSPLREDKTPSFSVSTQKNLWNDLGSGIGGNVIDLAIALNGNCTFHKAATWLEEQYRGFASDSFTENLKSRRQSFFNPQRPSESDFKDVRVEDLSHKALLSYLLNRGIPIEIGRLYCHEVHYCVYQKEYFGICFQNIVGGLEIRNAFFKGCYGEKAPSIIPISKDKHTSSCCVFEGFMDFLTYIYLKQKGGSALVVSESCDCIVLNSTSIVHKAVPFIQVYDHSYCYLDNDASGKKAFETIEYSMPGKAVLMSELYAGYNDLNDFLLGKAVRK